MTASFDGQANEFDQRTGLPDAICETIVDAVLQQLSIGNESIAQVVELGAGTGQIGQHFRSDRINYVGLDNSNEMLEIFETRISKESTLSNGLFEIVSADVNERWPVNSQSTHLVFSSRAIHLFDSHRICEELSRIASPKGLVFAAGRRKREKNSIQAIMRRQMRIFLSEQGITGRDGQNHIVKFTKILEQTATVHPLESKIVANWTTQRSPLDSLHAWRRKDGIAGLQIGEKTKEDVLDRLQNWAIEKFEDLSAKSIVHESYVIDLLRIESKT
ncbi:MAG: class I SAM-dependent methyltransferase [Planctomycetota bacterium]